MLDAEPRAEYLGYQGQAYYAAHVALRLHEVLRGHPSRRPIVYAAVFDALSRLQAHLDFTLVALLLEHSLDDFESYPQFRRVIQVDLAATLAEAMRDAARRS